MDRFLECVNFLKQHGPEATMAAGIFGLGWLFSVFIVKYNVRELMRFPLWFVGKLMGLIPPGSSPARIFFIIFCFNSIAMFLYMISGVAIIAPVIIDFLTGMHVGIVMFTGGLSQLPVTEDDNGPKAREADHPLDVNEEDGINFDGPTLLAAACGLLVVILELPALWFSIGMGMDIGYGIRGKGFVQLASPCAQAYVMVILPVLATSAIAETIAIRATGDIRIEQ